MSLNEFNLKCAALDWFGELGYAVGHGPHIAPGEPAAERDSFGNPDNVSGYPAILVGKRRGRARYFAIPPFIPPKWREIAVRTKIQTSCPEK